MTTLVKVVACVEVNLAENPLGLASRALEELGGKPVLRRTTEALGRCKEIHGVAVVTRPADEAAVRGALEGSCATVHSCAAPDVPQRRELRRARKWSREGWRGGLLWTTSFDEQGRPLALFDAAQKHQADSVAIVRAEAPLLDPALTDRIVLHHLKFRKTYYFTFAQAPVGILPEICTIDFLKTMAITNRTPMEVLRYKPEKPEMDRIRAECHFDAGDLVRRAPFRFTADSRRGLERIRALWSRADRPEETPASRWIELARKHPEIWAGESPPFVSVELVRDPDACPLVPPSPLPRFLEAGLAEALFGALSAWDDACVTLEGFGDPLTHPEIGRILRAARDRKIYGLHVVTPGGGLDEKAIDLLFEADADILEVRLQAHTDGTHRKVGAPGEFARIRAALDRFLAIRKERGEAGPILAPSLVKRREVEPEIEPFYDEWTARGAWPVIRAPNAYAGQVPDLALLATNLAKRIPCLKLGNELYVNTAGEILACRQDLAAREPIGRIGEKPLAGIWAGGRLTELRAAHRKGDWSAFPLCPPCKEWDRL